MGTKLIYPDAPPAGMPKPVFKQGKDRPDNNTGLWHIHDPAIFKDDITGKYYIYCTGADCHCSDDLIHWERVGKVASPLQKKPLYGLEARIYGHLILLKQMVNTGSTVPILNGV